MSLSAVFRPSDNLVKIYKEQADALLKWLFWV